MKKEDKESLFGCRVRMERKRLGLTQAEAAQRCGVVRETWGKYERGTFEIGGAVLRAFAALGADTDFIATGVRKGAGHTTTGAQVLRMKVLASLLADELYRRGAGLGEMMFHELLNELWPQWSVEQSPDTVALRGRIGAALDTLGVREQSARNQTAQVSQVFHGNIGNVTGKNVVHHHRK